MTTKCCETTYTSGDYWHAKHVVLEMDGWIDSNTFAVDVTTTKTGHTSQEVQSTIGTDAVEKKEL